MALIDIFLFSVAKLAGSKDGNYRDRETNLREGKLVYKREHECHKGTKARRSAKLFCYEGTEFSSSLCPFVPSCLCGEIT